MAQRFVFPFEKLDVWQLAIDLAETVLDILEKLPQTDQPNGICCSIASSKHS